MFRYVWVLPVAMTGWNILYVMYGIMAEYRIKATAFRYMLAYAGTIAPAVRRGDLEPFFQVFSSGAE